MSKIGKTTEEEIRKRTIEVNTFQEVDISGLTCPIIAVYIYPNDYPKAVIARIFEKDKPTNIVLIKNTLDEIRADIIKSFPWMVRLDRAENDVLSLAETWL